jgi:pyruvate dehydrogenase E1 component alpha subunit
VLAVDDAARRAVALVRDGAGPVFLELKTYRFRAHSMYDAERYRSKEEVAAWRARDPIELFAERLREAGMLDDARVVDLEAAISAEIDRAIAYAEAGTDEPVEDLTRFVYSEDGEGRTP